MYNHEEILKYLSPQDKEELALWEGLFNNAGFKLLLQKLELQYASAVSVIENAPTWEAYTYARGARDALNAVLNLEAVLEVTVQDKIEAAKEAIPADDEEAFL